MRQTAVVGRQKRLTRCFRELEVASEQHENSQNSLLNIYFHAREPWYYGYVTADEKTAFTKRLLVSRRILNYYAAVPEKIAVREIFFT